MALIYIQYLCSKNITFSLPTSSQCLNSGISQLILKTRIKKKTFFVSKMLASQIKSLPTKASFLRTDLIKLLPCFYKFSPGSHNTVSQMSQQFNMAIKLLLNVKRTKANRIQKPLPNHNEVIIFPQKT